MRFAWRGLLMAVAVLMLLTGGPVKVDLGMFREAADGLLSYNHDGVDLDTSDATLDYAAWSKEGDRIAFGVTDDGRTTNQSLDDGNEDESFDADDDADFDLSIDE